MLLADFTPLPTTRRPRPETIRHWILVIGVECIRGIRGDCKFKITWIDGDNRPQAFYVNGPKCAEDLIGAPTGVDANGNINGNYTMPGSEGAGPDEGTVSVVGGIIE